MSERGDCLSVSLLVLAILCFGGEASRAWAQVTIPPQPRNLLTAAVDADVTFDAFSGRYTYSYTVTNAASSQQEIDFLALEITGDIVNVNSPQGWTFDEHDQRMMVSWGATEIGPLPPDFVDDGNVLPSPFQIKPGESLGGFSFESAEPPDTATFYARGFAKLPATEGDAEEILVLVGGELPDFTEDSFTGTTVAPMKIEGAEPFPGGRRPGVDGFLGFLNIATGDTVHAPVSIQIKFALDGESVDPSSFRATLNREDVTQAFVPGGGTADLVAVFDVDSSPLQTGRNVLLTTIDGIVPGSTKTAADVDRITFFVE